MEKKPLKIISVICMDGEEKNFEELTEEEQVRVRLLLNDCVMESAGYRRVKSSGTGRESC